MWYVAHYFPTIRVHLDKLLQNGVLGLKWAYVKKLWGVAVGKQSLGF